MSDKDKIIIPDNVAMIFEDDCRGCDMAEPVVIKNGNIYRIGCNISEICRKAKMQAALERAKEFPYV